MVHPLHFFCNFLVWVLPTLSYSFTIKFAGMYMYLKQSQHMGDRLKHCHESTDPTCTCKHVIKIVTLFILTLHALFVILYNIMKIYHDASTSLIIIIQMSECTNQLMF